MIVPVDNNAENTGLGGNENKLTLTTLRAAQISNMHARLSNAFAADVEAMSDANINDREDDEAVGELARLMTLLNIYQDREEYEKCHLINKHIKRLEKIVENL